MLTVEAARSVYGAWRLLLGDRSGFDWFNATRAGFWRSFVAVAAIFPVHFGLRILATASSAEAEGLDWSRYLPAQIVAYAILCVGIPLVMFHVAGLLDRRDRYFGFIAAYNWSSIVVIGILAPLELATLMDLLPGGMGELLIVSASIGLLVYSGFIVVVALDVGVLAAAGIVVGDIFLSRLIMQVAATISHAQ